MTSKEGANVSKSEDVLSRLAQYLGEIGEMQMRIGTIQKDIALTLGRAQQEIEERKGGKA